jgi:hypothetical protein
MQINRDLSQSPDILNGQTGKNLFRNDIPSTVQLSLCHTVVLNNYDQALPKLVT